MACASLAMYDAHDPVRSANDRLWAGIRDRLRSAGFAAPDHLERQMDYHRIWLEPDLVLAQTCGYPYVTELIGRVRLVATPAYTFQGGTGTERVSFIVVRDNATFGTLESLRGASAAINDAGSNSGMNLFRAAIAPLADGGRFFSSVRATGGHLASLDAVRSAEADVASIDTVSWGLAALHQPERLKGLRILAETPSGPGLPFITRLGASDEEVATLRHALSATISDPAFADAMSALGLAGIEVLGDQDYDRLDAHRRDAERLGYPIIA